MAAMADDGVDGSALKVDGGNDGTDDKPNESDDESDAAASSDALVQYMVTEIRHMCRDRAAKVHDSLLSDVVRGGDVTLVGRVIEFLERRGLNDEAEWVLDKQDEQAFLGVDRGIRGCCRKFYKIMSCTVAFLLLLASFIVLSPVFYLYHEMQVALEARSMKNKRGKDRFLFEAVQSKNPNMVKLFLSKGTPIDTVDEFGNNMYHVIAWVSETDPKDAIACHNCVLKAVDDVRVLHDVIMTQRNEDGLTAMETIARHGSMELLKIISEERNLVGKSMVHIDTHNTIMGEHILSKKKSNFLKKEKITLKHLEAGIWGATAGLNMPEIEEMQPTSGSENFYSSLDIHRIDVSQYEQGDALGEQSFILQCIAGRSIEQMEHDDISALKKSSFINQWMNDKQKKFVVVIAVFHIIYFILSCSMLFALIWLDWIGSGSIQNLYVIPRYLESTTIYAIRKLAKGVRSAKVDAFQNNETFLSDEELENFVCPAAPHSKYGTNLTKCDDLLDSYLNRACGDDPAVYHMAQNYKTLDELQQNETELSYIIYGLCAYAAIQILFDLYFRMVYLIRNFKRQVTNPWARGGLLYNMRVISGRQMAGSYMERQLNLFAYWLTFVIVYMYVFSYDYIPWMGHAVKYLLSPANALKNPKEYEALFQKYWSGLDRLKDDYDHVDYIIVGCIIAQLINIIHSLRLIRTIGSFVLATKKLAKILANFLVVYGIISLAFALIFYLIMKNPDCSISSHPSFKTIGDCLFNVYLIAIGQGGDFYYDVSFHAKITFVVYTVISTLLLLNLFIAVMSAVAESLNQPPWRQMLPTVEMWGEIMGIECNSQILLLPLKSCRWGRKLFQRLVATYESSDHAYVEMRCSKSAFEGAGG